MRPCHPPHRRRVVWAPLRLHRAACRCSVAAQGQVSVCPGLDTLSPWMWYASSGGLAQTHHPPHRPYGGTLLWAALKVTEQRKKDYYTSCSEKVFQWIHKSKESHVSFTNDGNLGQACISPDEMISDTFIIGSFLQSIHYHYRQPVWFITSTLKSIKPQWTSWGKENEQTVCLHLWQRAQCLFRQMTLFISVIEPHNSLWLRGSVEPHLYKLEFGWQG